MSRTATILGNVSPTVRTGKRAIDIVAALAPPTGDPGKKPTVKIGKDSSESPGAGALKMVPGLVGAGLGAAVVSSHRLLGALGGHALAATVLPIYKGGAARKRALCQLGVEAAGIAGALSSKRHPVAGWLAGLVVGAAATGLVSGSPVRDAFQKWRSK